MSDACVAVWAARACLHKTEADHDPRQAREFGFEVQEIDLGKVSKG